MTKEQYLSAGETELSRNQFYQEIIADPSTETKTKQDDLVRGMFENGEITEKVSDYLQLGGERLSKLYHLLKTHNISVDLVDPGQWLEEQGFTERGIISCWRSD